MRVQGKRIWSAGQFMRAQLVIREEMCIRDRDTYEQVLIPYAQ